MYRKKTKCKIFFVHSYVSSIVDKYYLDNNKVVNKR